MDPKLEELLDSISDKNDQKVKIEFVLKNDHAVEVIQFVSELLTRK